VRPKTVGIAGLGLAVAACLGIFLWQVLVPVNPTVTCSLVEDTQRCQDTADTISSWPDLAFEPSITGRLTAIDIRPAPREWAASVDPGFRSARWGAYLERADGPAILAACQYASDAMVYCDTEQAPFVPPSN
jgi:hypothetical protein